MIEIEKRYANTYVYVCIDSFVDSYIDMKIVRKKGSLFLSSCLFFVIFCLQVDTFSTNKDRMKKLIKVSFGQERKKGQLGK